MFVRTYCQYTEDKIMKTLVMYCQEIISRRLWTHRDTLSRRCINTRCQDSISRYTYFQHTIVLLSRRYTYIRDDYVVVKTYFQYSYHGLSRHLSRVVLFFQDGMSGHLRKRQDSVSRYIFKTLYSCCQDGISRR